MQRLRFCVTNDRDYLDLHHVGLFPDGKLPLDYIWSYGLKLDETRSVEIHRNLSLFPRICSFTLSSCRFAVDFGEFLIPLRIRDVEGIVLCLHNPNGNPLARVVLLLPCAHQLRTGGSIICKHRHPQQERGESGHVHMHWPSFSEAVHSSEDRPNTCLCVYIRAQSDGGNN